VEEMTLQRGMPTASCDHTQSIAEEVAVLLTLQLRKCVKCRFVVYFLQPWKITRLLF
jgi:hypothetical protein